MHNGIKYALAFVAGSAIGGAATWIFMKTKCEQYIQKEVEAFKEDWINRQSKSVDNSEKTEAESKDESSEIKTARQLEINQYKNILNENSYKEGGSESVDEFKPYVITPEEFGDKDEYDTISLTYYADGVLADDCDEFIDNVDDVVGTDSLSHFGEYEDDSVFVRNDELKADYEILLDTRNYWDVKSKLNPLNDE